MQPIFLETCFIGLGTYLMRAGSLSFSSRKSWPQGLQDGLSLVTPAVLGALLGPLLIPSSTTHLGTLLYNTTFWAAIPTAFTAYVSRNLLVTLAAGLMSYAVLSLIL